MGLERLLTPVETAEMLGIAVATLAIWRSTRRIVLPHIKVGRHVMYHPDDVAAFIAARRVNGLPGTGSEG